MSHARLEVPKFKKYHLFFPLGLGLGSLNSHPTSFVTSKKFSVGVEKYVENTVAEGGRREKRPIYCKEDYDGMREDKKVNWEGLLKGNLEDLYDKFISVLTQSIWNRIPRSRANQKPKKGTINLDKEVRKKIKQKHRLWERDTENKA